MENEPMCKSMYTKHNGNVVNKTPPHLLTVYNIKQGWLPLLKMLNRTHEINTTEFPHVNGGTDMDSISFFARLIAFIYPIFVINLFIISYYLGFVMFKYMSCK
tara:strand:- start:192 stop:500 length:309 start_codon:yes stop_codon:yes gene_type:complete